MNSDMTDFFILKFFDIQTRPRYETRSIKVI